jgi:hypothetical protein
MQMPFRLTGIWILDSGISPFGFPFSYFEFGYWNLSFGILNFGFQFSYFEFGILILLFGF